MSPDLEAMKTTGNYPSLTISACQNLQLLTAHMLAGRVSPEEEIPELEIDIDELLELTDEGQRSRLQELLQECGKPKEDFINGLLYRMKGLRKMSGPLKK
ncbi:protein phosphatase 1 regulatory subunit 14B isoform X2 [Takifugu flavidus]|uniref:Uncharacterized protein n=1 Tax=Takifugu bimaculatus TaxID=433685 RepID=A0A4Z2BTM0_9TELE|nr:protein phosphatase 1 regulatory subunit 14B isoform X2 [Takifugu flavidus]TNM95573.1 hypothetical protein fugu_016656 [Takifugu bimaculatus]